MTGSAKILLYSNINNTNSKTVEQGGTTGEQNPEKVLDYKLAKNVCGLKTKWLKYFIKTPKNKQTKITS